MQNCSVVGQKSCPSCIVIALSRIMADKNGSLSHESRYSEYYKCICSTSSGIIPVKYSMSILQGGLSVGREPSCLLLLLGAPGVLRLPFGGAHFRSTQPLLPGCGFCSYFSCSGIPTSTLSLIWLL